MNAEIIANVRDDGAYAIINGNYAIGAGIKISDALAIEDKEGIAAEAYANVIAVREGYENSEKIQVLLEALKTEKVRNYINTTYLGAVIPLF